MNCKKGCLEKILMESNENTKKDFEWAFGLNRICLDLIGLWPQEVEENADGDKGGDEKNDEDGIRHLQIPVMLFLIVIGAAMPQLYALTLVYRELRLVLDNLTTNYCIITAVIKLFFLWKNRRVFRPVLQSALFDWYNARNNLCEHEIMRKQARRGRIFTACGYVVMFFSFVVFLIFPFFGLKIRIINNITDYEGEQRSLPLQSYYPFEIYRSPFFEIAYVSQVTICSFAAACFSIPDYFFGALVFHASAQCEILRHRMGNLLPMLDFDIKGVTKSVTKEEKLFRTKLGSLVDTHVHLIRFVEAIEHSFNLLILAQTCCLILTVCCLCYGVIKSLGSEHGSIAIIELIALGGSALTLMIHMLVYCLASEILAQHSATICDAAYQSGWYLLPTKYTRDIVLVMVRAKFPLQLTAGKFFCLSLNAFINILKSSLGYVSVLLAASS